MSETLTYYAFPDIHWQKIRTTDVFDKPLNLLSSHLSAALFQ